MKKFIKNNIKFIIVIAICLFGSVLTTIAAGNYLFNSKDIEYDNTTSGIQSTNVSDAIDELYACASNYAAYNTRLSTVESNQVTFNTIYPIGSIYISVENTNPGTLFGGTWVSFGSGRTLVGVDTNDTSFDTVEETGGAKTATLETANLPSHSHYYTPAGTNSGAAVAAHTYTPAGTNSGAAVADHTYTPAGTINVVVADHTYTPVGSVSSTFSGTRKTTENAGKHSHTFGMYKTGTAQNGTGTSYNLYLSLAGTNTITTSEVSAHNHYYTPAGSVSSTFTGIKAILSHTVSTKTFTGTKATLSHTVTQPTFTGTKATLSHTVTQPTFTGTRAQTETTGSGTSFSTQDKYITVYMWKRTA